MKIYGRQREYEYWFEPYIGKRVWVRVKIDNLDTGFICILEHDYDWVTFKYISLLLSKQTALNHIFDSYYNLETQRFLHKFRPTNVPMTYTTDEIVDIVQELF